MKEFWKSKTFWAGLTVLLTNLLALVGALGIFQLSPEVTAAILAMWNSVLGVLAIIWRWNATEALTTTQQKPKVRRW